jgi:hypothetical protein
MNQVGMDVNPSECAQQRFRLVERLADDADQFVNLLG